MDSLRRNVIIVEEDSIVSERLVSSLVAYATRESSSVFAHGSPQINYLIFRNKEELIKSNPDEWDLVVTATYLSDGSGFDVLSFVHGLRPDVPVIMTGTPHEASIAVEAINAGVSDYLLITGHEFITFPVAVQKCLTLQSVRKENDDLHSDLSHSLSELAVANRELQQMIRRLEVAARTDDLTQLSNRRWLNVMLENRWAETTRNAVPLGFIMIDLDGFKSLNDQLGHQKGDELLKLAAKVISSKSRSIDLSARYGGDEFCVLMPHASRDAAMSVAERISSAFNKAVQALQLPKAVVSMSIGVSHWSTSGGPSSALELVRHADQAMYEAKTHKAENIVFFQSKSEKAA